METCKLIAECGCKMLVITGRTKDEIHEKQGPANWEMIRKIKAELDIPVIANGGIHKFEDIEKCLKATGCDGVMSGEAVLENPRLFNNEIPDLDEVAMEYLELA